ncbi:MAG: hypothetical protein LBV77_02545 [Candidatus Adiutrix intracellularis]|nr:hypothetical protein [Candidatus Adiutrix intracellularis]
MYKIKEAEGADVPDSADFVGSAVPSVASGILNNDGIRRIFLVTCWNK